MKKLIPSLLLAFFAVVSGSVNVLGQVCTPDTTMTSPGIFPLQLEKATPGTQYNQVLFFKVPKDTNIIFMGNPTQAIIDSMKVSKVIGLPGDFTWFCHNNRCAMPGGTNGCLTITGMPLISQEGVYPLQFIVTTYGKVFSFPVQQNDTNNNYVLAIGDAASIKNTGTEKQPFKIYPNPASDVLNIEFAHSVSGDIALEITDLSGRIISSENGIPMDNGLKINRNIAHLPSGLYIVKITAGGAQYLRKLAVN